MDSSSAAPTDSDPDPDTALRLRRVHRPDASTQGAWSSDYGGDGYALAGGPSSLPSYATATVAANVYTWAAPTADPRALADPAGAPPAGLAATWYSATAFSVDLHLTDGQAHRVALYALDWDNYGGGRAETVTVTDDATGAVLDTRSLASFQSGVYLVWTLKGNVTVTRHQQQPRWQRRGEWPLLRRRHTPTPTPPSGSASFVAADAATQGAWRAPTAATATTLAGGPSSLPSYATATVAANVYTWAGATPDPRALADPAGAPPAGLAATWYSTAAFSVDLHLTDGQAHRVALYALDWDNYGGGRRDGRPSPTTPPGRSSTPDPSPPSRAASISSGPSRGT